MTRRPSREPRLSKDELHQRANTLQALTEALRALIERRHNVAEEGRADVEAILADTSPPARAYALLGTDRHEQDAKAFAADRARRIEPHVARALFQARHSYEELRRDLDAFESDARQAPTVEAAFIDYVGTVGVTADQILLLAAVEQMTRGNLRDELRSMRPSERLALYESALSAPLDPVNATTIRVIEERRLPYPDTPMPDSEAAAASALGRKISDTQSARVPDTATVHKALDHALAAVLVAERAGVRALNPDHSDSALEPLPDLVAAAE